MTGDYSLADITVLEFDDAVRRWPGMYFEKGPADPAMPTLVLRTVLRHVLHPAPATGADHAAHVLAEVTADLAFTVTDDLPGAAGPTFFGSLISVER